MQDSENRSYRLILPEQGYSELEDLAEIERRPMSDMFREALEEYAKRRHKKNINLRVQHGGKRKRKAD